MSVQLLCDSSSCDQPDRLIQDGTERYDVSSLPRRDTVTGLPIPGATFNFHPTCYGSAGPVMPVAGVSVNVTHVAAVTPPPPDPAAAVTALPAAA